jgi:hypothetical protein
VLSRADDRSFPGLRIETSGTQRSRREGEVYNSKAALSFQ